MVIYFFLLSWLIAPAPCFADEWQKHALRLTGESDKVRADAIVALKATPNLAGQLKAALGGTDKYLALDTVAALSLESLLPDLIQSSLQDADGTIHLTINALLNSGNRRQITDLYLARLKTGQRADFSVPAQMVMLDTLARTQNILPDGDIADLMRSPFYEVRSATLYYVRHLLKRLSRAPYFRAIDQALHDPYFQLRIQAIYTLRELPGKSPEKEKWIAVCASETHPKVKQVCDEPPRKEPK